MSETAQGPVLSSAWLHCCSLGRRAAASPGLETPPRSPGEAQRGGCGAVAVTHGGS